MKMTEIITKFLILLTGFLLPLETFITIILILVVLDLITGLWKNIRLNKEEKTGNILANLLLSIRKIRSRGLKRTLIKFSAYSIALLVAQILTNIFVPGINLAYFVAFYASLTESASIFENLAVITNNKIFLKIFDIIKTKLNIDKDIIDKIDITSSDKEKDNL